MVLTSPPSGADDPPAAAPGAVQPHGLLLVLNPADLTILQISDNCRYWTGQEADELLGESLGTVLSAQNQELLRCCLNEGVLGPKSLRVLTTRMSRRPQTRVGVSAYLSDVLVIEIETELDDVGTVAGHARYRGMIQRIFQGLKATESLTEFGQVAALEISRVTQLDRVTVYRRNPDGSSQVVGEARSEGLGSWLGMHIPACDLPAPFREMWQDMGIRPVPNARADMAKLVPPLNPMTGQPLDMRECALRGFSSVFAEYLQNVGAAAMLTIPVVGTDGLWGLVACHHRVPKRFPHHLRMAAQILGQIVSMALGHVLERQRLQSEHGDATERALRISEERLRLALQISRGFIFDWAPQTDLLVHSEGLELLLGLTPEQIRSHETGRAFFRLLHPDDLAGFMARIQGLSPKRPGYVDVYGVLRHDGQKVYLEECGRGTFDQHGRLVRLLGMAADITQRHAAEQALRLGQHELKTLTDNCPDILSRFDRHFRHVFLNAAVERITGLPRAHFLGKSSRELGMPSTLCDLWEEAMQGVFATGEPAEIEFDFPSPGGTTHLAARLLPERDEHGRVTHILGVTRDISEQRRLDAGRDQLLTAERDARNAIERAALIKDEFIATVTHELRSPLGAIMGWAAVIMRGHGDEAVLRQGIEAISRNARTQARLIDDLLDVSRIVSGKLRMHVELMDVNLVAILARDNIAPAAQAKGIALKIGLAEHPGKVMGDPQRLHQVLSNLLNNAIKFTPRGGEVLITTRVGPEGGVDIDVSDTGKGIEAHFLPRLFDRFTQADVSESRLHGGLGLGLSICKHLVDLHGGHLSAVSPGLGLGAVFSVHLPTSLVDHPEVEGATEPASLDEVRQDLSGISVLLVDDQLDTLELNRRLLNEVGAKVSVATSASEALAQLRDGVPDLLVSDIGMPHMDGYAFIKAIRGHSDIRIAKLTAVALTAYAREQDRQRVLDAGYQAFLSKPIQPFVLVRTLRDLLRH